MKFTYHLISRLLLPHSVVLFTATMSFIAWVVPWPEDWRVGYFEKESLNFNSLLVILAWYVSIAIFGYLGYMIGRRIKPLSRLERVNTRSFYVIISIIAAIGTLFSYLIILRNLGLAAFSASILELSVNNLRYALPYKSGLQTLRYAAIPAAAYAMYRISSTQKVKGIDLMNILGLAGVALLASRLSLAMTGLIFLGLIAKRLNISIRQLLVLAIITYGALTLLNWSRNAPFYEAIGVHNPFIANAQEMVTYLGTPFQVQMGIWNNQTYPMFPDIENLFSGLFYLLTPTYFQGQPSGELISELELYREYVDVERSLTTNSAFAFLFALLGVFAFPFMWVISLVGGVLVGHFTLYNSSPVRMVAYAVLYAFSEIWRVYIFNAGIVHFVVISIISSALLGSIRVFKVYRYAIKSK